MGARRTRTRPLTLIWAREDGIPTQDHGKENGQKWTGSRAISDLVSTEFGNGSARAVRKQGDLGMRLRMKVMIFVL